ncbi:DNA polymerase IV [Allohahella sp. A8]|uniref:DNA polymerase IV n=1 Tax=Allohahella sp. A8 TaxID=3141461 RepID=UPI000C0BAC97|nr:DNA polymerase IV [Hahellaceae bacterium]|tara:strand:+ start:1088 stop:2185 length:1098 start_codon:yes stop_codon:yes gene_type:complete
MTRSRKIIHIDADAFYAAIEIRDDPGLRGLPVAVGGSADRRGVITTCSYEARRYGVRSAMSTGEAMRLCPHLVLVGVNMDKYRSASAVMRDIFKEYTDLVEPLSLDEAYLDVSDSRQCRGSATLMATEIRRRIFEALAITVSAGVAPNKFLAKIASDWNKPDGLKVVRPDEVEDFVTDLPVKRIHGVGRVTAERLQRHGIETCGDIRSWQLNDLMKQFGSFGHRLHEFAYGRDEREVTSDRIRKSVSVEHTYAEDLADAKACYDCLPDLLERLNTRLSRMPEHFQVSKSFVKVKFDNFTTTTLERVGTDATADNFAALFSEALARENRAVRLLGIGVRFRQTGDAHGGIQLDLFPELAGLTASRA